MRTRIIGWGIGAVLTAGILLTYENVRSNETDTQFVQGNPGEYCAKLRDGKMIVIYQGKELTGDVFLNNGATVKPDATIITRDGVRTNLQDGDCIDQNGNITRAKVE